MTTTVVEDLGAMTHWHTIQIMNWSPAEAQSKFAPGPGTAVIPRTPVGEQAFKVAIGAATAVIAATAVKMMESQKRPHIEQPVCFFWMKRTTRMTLKRMARAAKPLVAAHIPQGTGGRQKLESEEAHCQKLRRGTSLSAEHCAASIVTVVEVEPTKETVMV